MEQTPFWVSNIHSSFYGTPGFTDVYKSGHEPHKGLDTKTRWLTDRQL
jgi:hypothetical protein